MITLTKPEVSILLPIYNAEPFLKECIESILSQTFTDFELLALDDGSTDSSLSVVESYKDERIRILRHSHNFINTLNQGIKSSRGEYIARMDADDIMIPTRLEKQVAVMKDSPKVAVCSTYTTTFGKGTYNIGIGRGVIKHPLIELLKCNFIAHPTVMLRRDFLEKNNITYHPSHPYAEDYKVWTDICREGGGFYVIDECLLKYRLSTNQISTIYHDKQAESSNSIQQAILEELIAQNRHKESFIRNLYHYMLKANHFNMLDSTQIFNSFYQIFMAIEDTKKQNAGIFL